MSDKDRPTTHLCTYSEDAITVRGRDLVGELMGRVTFTQMMFLEIMGRLPDATETAIVDAVLVTIMEHGLTPSTIAARLTHHGAPEAFQAGVAAGLLGIGGQFVVNPLTSQLERRGRLGGRLGHGRQQSEPE